MDSVTVSVSTSNHPSPWSNYNELSSCGDRSEQTSVGVAKHTSHTRRQITRSPLEMKRNVPLNRKMIPRTDRKEVSQSAHNTKSKIRNRSATLTLSERWLPLIVRNDGEFFVRINPSKYSGPPCLSSDIGNRRWMDVLQDGCGYPHMQHGTVKAENSPYQTQTCSHAAQSNSLIPHSCHGKNAITQEKKPYFELVSSQPLAYRVSACEKHRVHGFSEIAARAANDNLHQVREGPSSHRTGDLKLLFAPVQPPITITTKKPCIQPGHLIHYGEAKKKRTSIGHMNVLQASVDITGSIQIPHQVIGTGHLNEYPFHSCDNSSRSMSRKQSVFTKERSIHLPAHNIVHGLEFLGFQHGVQLCVQTLQSKPNFPDLCSPPTHALLSVKDPALIEVETTDHDGATLSRLQTAVTNQEEWTQILTWERHSAFRLLQCSFNIRREHMNLASVNRKQPYHVTCNSSAQTGNLNESFDKDVLDSFRPDNFPHSVTPVSPQWTSFNVKPTVTQTVLIHSVQLQCAHQFFHFSQVDLNNCERGFTRNSSSPENPSISLSHSGTSSALIPITDHSDWYSDSWKEFGSPPLYLVEGEDEYELTNSQMENMVNNYILNESLNREMTPCSGMDVEQIVGIHSAPSRLQTTPQPTNHSLCV